MPVQGYDVSMNDRVAKDGNSRRVLLVVLAVAILALLGAAAVVVVPILTHQSAGGSGQKLPTDFAATAEANGADGRTRMLAVETLDGEPADLSKLRAGEEVVVRGSGYDPAIGIYVSICLVPEKAGEKPSPCLGGLPEGAMEGEAAGSDEALSSAWITDDWAWKAFANKGYDDAERGAFEVHLLVPPAAQEGIDCAVQQCAVTTRADHTAATDRVQDMQLPVKFAR